MTRSLGRRQPALSPLPARGRLLTLPLLALALLLTGCGTSSGAVAARSAPGGDRGIRADESVAATSRPGLGTSWGESRDSAIRLVDFARANPTTPSATASIQYNDREGVEALAGPLDRGQGLGAAAIPVPGTGVTVALRDASGDCLPAVFAAGRTWVVGESGVRYVIHLRNRSNLLLEIVASVDGLDVRDGRPASFAKRGYLVSPHGELIIDGWRQSADQVAAFRFGSVRDSYAAQMGAERNVGVIGVAVFHERGAIARWPWVEDELRRRQTADPFPGSAYAVPPPGRRLGD